MKKRYLIVLLCLSSLELFAQQNEGDSTSSPWNFSAWAEMFILPGEADFFNPTFYARREKLHIEGRYNYEDRNTGSVWVGPRFKFGKSVSFLFVPMAGVVFGNTNGMAPGLEIEIVYKKLDFYAETEHVFDFNSQENSFFYMYSELAIRPIKPIRTGLVTQRTKLFESERELERGLFGEYYYKRFRTGIFYFNPFSSDYFLIASLSVDF